MEDGFLTYIVEVVKAYTVEIIAIGSVLGVTIEKTPIEINPISWVKKIFSKGLKEFGNAINHDLTEKVHEIGEEVKENSVKITEIEQAHDFANIDIMEQYLSQRYKYSINNGFLYNNEYKAIRAFEFKYKLLIIKYEHLPPGKIPDEDMIAMFKHFNSEFEKGNVRFNEPQAEHKNEPSLNQGDIDMFIQEEIQENQEEKGYERTRRK